MKKVFLIVSIMFFTCVSAFSQLDTTIKYYGRNGKETKIDSATSYVKFFRQANMWRGMEYYTKRNMLKSEGDYSDTNLNTAVGSINYYKEDGKLDYTNEYAEGKLMEKTYFYKNGNKKSYTAYEGNGVRLQKGWDDNGREIKNFIVEREAQFKGGEDGWKKYLEKNLNVTIPTAVGAPPGVYEVQVQFVVDKVGIPGNIKAVSVPAKCKACGAEALRVLRESPKWDPAILNNELVNFETAKTIVFQPVEGVRKGKG